MKLKNCVTASALTLFVAAAPAMAKSSKGKNGTWSGRQRTEINQQFSRFDRNGDGLITRAEFPADATLFDRLDLNRDGALTRFEIEQAVPDRAAAERQLRAYDRNGDGVIS